MGFVLSMLLMGLGCREKPGQSQRNAVPPRMASKTASQTPDNHTSVDVRQPFSESQLHQTCCVQCTNAASMDPTGADISMKPCGAYSGTIVNGKVLVEDMCADYFLKKKFSVMDCR